jgi:SAM-dependent methyltransferase
MSSEAHLILEAVPPGAGGVLDLGGSTGMLRSPLQARGYRYINLDVRRFANGEPSLLGDAHHLPFKDAALDMVVSKDTLEHFLDPWCVVQEIHRVLKDGGHLIIWVPFMHPFHGDDFYRYSPLGLHHLLQNFEIVMFDSPLWVFTVIGLALIEVCNRAHLGFMAGPIRRLCGAFDRLVMGRQRRVASFAAAYRITACKRGKAKL